MQYKFKYILLPAMAFLAQCTIDKKSDTESAAVWLKPESGMEVKLGDKLELQVQIPAGTKVDSIIYLVDAFKVGSSNTEKPINITTENLPLGDRLITARIYKKETPEEITTSIGLRPKTAPQKFGYQVKQVFPHDTSSYTQGLEFHEGVFYESDGLTGESSLRKVQPATGKVLQKVDMPKETFAEGLAVIDDKIIQLTWQEGKGMVYDKATFKKLSEFPYQNSREGWGLCFDSKRLIKSDGSNYLYFLNKDNYREEGFIEVYDTNGPVDQLNELEFIDGKIYANVYLTNRIVIIDPKNGQVTGEIDLSGILPDTDHFANTDVLNGIAWDSKSRRLFVTGKKWDKLFEIQLIKQ